MPINSLKATTPNQLRPQTRSRFVDEFLLDLDAEAAAGRTGIQPHVARRLLASQSVQRDIAARKRERATRTEIYADEVLRRLWLLATADARELVEVRRVACRYCHGIDHRYHYTQEELRTSRQKHFAAQMKLAPHLRTEFDDEGGDGFDKTAAPAPDCPECSGEGETSVYLHDSRDYSPAAQLLFNGVKVGKDGSFELKLRDQAWAMDNVRDHLGMKVNRHAVAMFDPAKMAELSVEQLDAALEAFGVLRNTTTTIDHEPNQ